MFLCSVLSSRRLPQRGFAGCGLEYTRGGSSRYSRRQLATGHRRCSRWRGSGLLCRNRSAMRATLILPLLRSESRTRWVVPAHAETRLRQRRRCRWHSSPVLRNPLRLRRLRSSVVLALPSIQARRPSRRRLGESRAPQARLRGRVGEVDVLGDDSTDRLRGERGRAGQDQKCGRRSPRSRRDPLSVRTAVYQAGGDFTA